MCKIWYFIEFIHFSSSFQARCAFTDLGEQSAGRLKLRTDFDLTLGFCFRFHILFCFITCHDSSRPQHPRARAAVMYRCVEHTCAFGRAFTARPVSARAEMPPHLLHLLPSFLFFASFHLPFIPFCPPPHLVPPSLSPFRVFLCHSFAYKTLSKSGSEPSGLLLNGGNWQHMCLSAAGKTNHTHTLTEKQTFVMLGEVWC